MRAKTTGTGGSGRGPRLRGMPSMHAMRGMPSMTVHLPTGVSQSPKGDIGAHRQQEARAVGGFSTGKTVTAASAFTTRYKGAS